MKQNPTICAQIQDIFFSPVNMMWGESHLRFEYQPGAGGISALALAPRLGWLRRLRKRLMAGRDHVMGMQGAWGRLKGMWRRPKVCSLGWAWERLCSLPSPAASAYLLFLLQPLWPQHCQNWSFHFCFSLDSLGQGQSHCRLPQPEQRHPKDKLWGDVGNRGSRVGADDKEAGMWGASLESGTGMGV